MAANNDLQKVAVLVTKMPIGIKYKNAQGEYSTAPLDPKDNKIDGTNAFLPADAAQGVIQKQIDKIDTSDKIEDPDILTKIETMTAALDSDAAATTN